MPRQAEALKERTYKRGSKVRQGIRSVQPGPVEYPDLLRLKIHAARQDLGELALLHAYTQRACQLDDSTPLAGLRHAGRFGDKMGVIPATHGSKAYAAQGLQAVSHCTYRWPGRPN